MAIQLRNVDGVYHLVVKGAGGRDNLISTACTDRSTAQTLVKTAGLTPLVAEHLDAAKQLKAQVSDVLRSTQNGNCLRVIELWGAYLHLKNTPFSAKEYLRYAHAFVAAHNLGHRSMESVGLDAMLNWVNEPTKRIPTRMKRLDILKSLFAYAHHEGFTRQNHAALLFINRRLMTFDQLERQVRLPFTEEEYRKILGVTTGFWHFATALSYWTALRFGDICNLERASLTFDPNAIIVHTRKRSKRVALSLDDPLIGSGELRRIIADILAQPDSDPWCFPYQHNLYTFKGSDGEQSWVYRRLLNKAGIPKGKSFYNLRHTAITRWKDAGKTVEEIGTLVGHSKTTTTEGYVHA